MSQRYDDIRNIKTLDDFSKFVYDLSYDFNKKPETWANQDLKEYLKTVRKFVEISSVQGKINQNTNDFSWEYMAQIFLVPKVKKPKDIR